MAVREMLITPSDMLNFFEESKYRKFIEWIEQTMKNHEDYEYDKSSPIFIKAEW